MARKVNIGLIPQIIEEGPVPSHGLYMTMTIPDDATEQEMIEQTAIILDDMGDYLVSRGRAFGDDSAHYEAFAQKIKEMFTNGQ